MDFILLGLCLANLAGLVALYRRKPEVIEREVERPLVRPAPRPSNGSEPESVDAKAQKVYEGLKNGR